MTAERRKAAGVLPSRVWGLWLVGTLLACLPLLITSIPPLGQHFYNIVRIDILSHPASYAGKSRSSAGMHCPISQWILTVPWLAKVMPVEWAAWLFLVVELGLLTSGCVMLSRVVNGRWSWLPLSSFLLLYNWMLIRGYDNFLFGLGLCFWGIALHISLRRATVARIVVTCCTAPIIYICHLFPLAVFALVIGTWELGCLIEEGKLRIRSLALHAAASLLPLVVPVVLLAHSSTGGLGGSIDFGLIHLRTKVNQWLDVFAMAIRWPTVAILSINNSPPNGVDRFST